MAKFDPTAIDFVPMSIKQVKVGQKVLTIELERGTVKAVSGDEISVRLRGDHEVSYYSAKELHLLEEVFNDTASATPAS